MTNSDIFEETKAGYTVRLEYDDDATTPWEDDEEFIHVAFFHRHYDYRVGLGKDFSEPEDFEEFAKENKLIALSLYMYDHSGLRFNTGGFHAYDSMGWDWGQVGYVFMTYETIREEYGYKRITAERRAKIESILRGFVETLDQYASGDVYGYILTPEDDEDDVIDSCWGFYGYDNAKEEALNVLNSYATRKEALANAYFANGVGL